MYHWLLRNAQQQPDEIGLIDEQGAFTWRQMADGALRLCELAREATQRTAIGVLLPSGSTFYSSYFGCLMAAKTVVPINFLLGEKELSHIVADSGIDVILSAGPLAQRFAELPCRMIDVSSARSPGNGAPPVEDRTQKTSLSCSTPAAPRRCPKG